MGVAFVGEIDVYCYGFFEELERTFGVPTNRLLKYTPAMAISFRPLSWKLLNTMQVPIDLFVQQPFCFSFFFMRLLYHFLD